MKKIHGYARNVCAIIFLLEFCIGCGGVQWNWKPDPYAGDSPSQALYNSTDKTIPCKDPAFDRMTCFTEEDIASLKYNIDALKLDKKTKGLVMTEFYKAFPLMVGK